mmetsp:Transcript_108897/g.213358  ORF Transcript_108897/g.213358 Transcript_108897/m.213358 type:complete len:94 (-) Transcript_108897:2223-2504(-)
METDGGGKSVSSSTLRGRMEQVPAAQLRLPSSISISPEDNIAFAFTSASASADIAGVAEVSAEFAPTAVFVTAIVDSKVKGGAAASVLDFTPE